MKPERPRLRRVYILPNSITALNLFFGVLAIYNILLSAGDPARFERGCWYVLLAALCDGFDGMVARLTHSQSEFGLQFDSLSDVVSFGVAPSFAAFSILSKIDGGKPDRIAGAICAVFAICGALRLARYNVQAHGSERTGFVGLPIPGGGGALVLTVMLIHHYGLLDARQAVAIPGTFGMVTVLDLVATALPVLIVLLALLMVSEVPYPSVMRRIRLRRRMSFGTFVTIVVLGITAWIVKHHQGVASLAVALLFLAFVGFAFYFPTVLLVRWALGRGRAGEGGAGRGSAPTATGGASVTKREPPAPSASDGKAPR